MIHITNKQRKGISTVLTTLIVVVASVVLGSAVTLFGTSLFQSGIQQQSLAVSGDRVFINAAGTESIGAFVVRNTGDKVIGIDTITVRGTPVPFASWWYNNTASNLATLAAKELAYESTPATFPCVLCIDFVDASTVSIAGTQATGPVLLKTGQIMIVYYTIPSGKITSADLGASVSVGVFAGTATAVKTVTVQSDT